MSTNNIAGEQLRAFIERIERLEEDKKTVADEIKDVYAEAKGTGFDVKAIRRIVAIRRQDQDKRREEEEILDLYMQALGVLADTPLGRSAVERDLGQRVHRAAADAFGERRELTEDEKAKGYTVGFKGKDGHSVAMKFGAAPKRVHTTVEERIARRSALVAGA